MEVEEQYDDPLSSSSSSSSSDSDSEDVHPTPDRARGYLSPSEILHIGELRKILVIQINETKKKVSLFFFR
jgi:hypothetical protein